MTFEEWLHSKPEGELSVFECLLDDDYVKRRDALAIIEEAYEAGCNACASSRSDMTYGEYLEYV